MNRILAYGVSILLTIQTSTQGGEETVDTLYQKGKVYVYQVGDSKAATVKYRAKSIAVGKDGEKSITIEQIYDELSTTVTSHDNLISSASVRSRDRRAKQELLFSVPVRPGEEWETSRSLYGIDVKEKRIVKGTEKLDTPIGKLNVVRVDFKTSFLGETLTGSQWYAYDGGLIKSSGYVGDLTLRDVTDK